MQSDQVLAERVAHPETERHLILQEFAECASEMPDDSMLDLRASCAVGNPGEVAERSPATRSAAAMSSSGYRGRPTLTHRHVCDDLIPHVATGTVQAADRRRPPSRDTAPKRALEISGRRLHAGPLKQEG